MGAAWWGSLPPPRKGHSRAPPRVAGVVFEEKTLSGSLKQIKDQIKVCIWGKWKVVWDTEQCRMLSKL